MKDGDDPIQLLLAEQKQTLADFGVNFDNYFSEKSLHDSGAVKEAIETFKKLDATYEQDGATFFASTRFGDDKDRALVKADGDFTYFAADIAYHKNKVDRGFAELVNVLGADHHGYIARIRAAVKVLDPKVEMNVIIGQLVNLFRDGQPVRMSKRTGDMIELREVMDEIGIDAARYYLVMRKTDSHLDFDLMKAKEQSDDNPVFYVQYATARIAGILRNAAEHGATDGVTSESDGAPLDAVDCEDARDVALELAKFPETLVAIANDLEPHRIPAYLENLATVFHRYYHHNRVLGEDKAVTARRLRLIHAVRNALKTGLELIGVSAPERM
jgi:arginyl-tRNA synthetase